MFPNEMVMCVVYFIRIRDFPRQCYELQTTGNIVVPHHLICCEGIAGFFPSCVFLQLSKNGVLPPYYQASGIRKGRKHETILPQLFWKKCWVFFSTLE